MDIQGIIPPSLLHMRGCKSSGSVEYRTVVSPHAGTHENHNGLYVASQVLGNDTMVARSVDDTTMVAHSSDVLQFINNDVPRFSHLTYHTEVPMSKETGFSCARSEGKFIAAGIPVANISDDIFRCSKD